MKITNEVENPSFTFDPVLIKSAKPEAQKTEIKPGPNNPVGQRWTYDPLAGRTLAGPVHGVRVSELGDTFNAARGSSRRHEAVDIAEPRGRPVYAVDDGTLFKLFKSMPGGLTVDQFDAMSAAPATPRPTRRTCTSQSSGSGCSSNGGAALRSTPCRR